MSVCVWAAGQSLLCVASCSFALVWTHSVEKTEWIERWRVQGDALIQTQALVKGSGAGMEPPEYARLEHGWWVWEPVNPLRLADGLNLAASGATGQGWRLCAGNNTPCVDLSVFEGHAPDGLWLRPSGECVED